MRDYGGKYANGYSMLLRNIYIYIYIYTYFKFITTDSFKMKLEIKRREKEVELSRGFQVCASFTILNVPSVSYDHFLYLQTFPMKKKICILIGTR